LQFAVALDEASYLQLDDVVVTVRDLPGGGHVATSEASRPDRAFPQSLTGRIPMLSRRSQRPARATSGSR
jgi:hypothetical protein